MKRLILTSTMAAVVCLACFCRGQETNKVRPSHRKHIEPLQYFIGDWELTGEINLAGQPKAPFVIHRHLEWTLGDNFIETMMTQVMDGKKEIRHKSIIGWDAEKEQITEWGFWTSHLPTKHPAWAETVTWSKEGKTWLIERENVKGVFTIIDENTHKYECEFKGDDGSENSWYFTAERKKK